MDAFEDDLERLREKGIGLKLIDKDIDACMVYALMEAKQTLAPPKPKTVDIKPKPSKLCRCFKTTALVIFVLFLFFGCFYVVANNSPAVQRHVMQALEGIVHPVSRYWRLMTLPLARKVDLSDYYEDNCLVSNPYFSPDQVACDDYNGAGTLVNVSDLTVKDFTKNYMSTSKVLLIKDMHHEIHYSTLRSWYTKHQSDLENTRTGLYARGCDEIMTLKDLLQTRTSRDLRGWPDCHVEWISNTVNPSRLLRQLFTRPTFLPNSVELSISKSLVVDSPKAGTHPLVPGKQSFPNAWYVQGSGTRKLFIMPEQHCLYKVKPISIVIEPGDIVHFNRAFWNIESSPVVDVKNTDISVGFIGTFM